MSTTVNDRQISDPKLAPGPSGLPLVGSLWDVRTKGVLEFYLDTWREFGDVTRFQMGPVTLLQFVRPEHVRHVLVRKSNNYIKGFSHDKLRVPLGLGLFTSEGSLWRRQRRLMGPTYTPRAVAQFADIVLDSTEKMLARWQAEFRDVPIPLNSEMMRLTMEVISRAMFTLDVGEEYAQVGKAISFILEFANKRTISLVDPPLFVPTPMNLRLKRALAILDDFIYGIIAERRQQPPGDDLLSTLMHARDEETGEVMGDEQLRDEVLITFFAGHETTAQLLTWTWYLLAQHPDVAARVHDELDRVLGGEPPSVDGVEALTYTRMVLDEALRLYSPVAMVARDVVADDEVDGYFVPAGSLVAITPYITHRHPEFWERPGDFYPEHFLPEQVKARPRYAYYPFGAGPRICIGKYFALQEVILVVAETARRFRLRLLPGQEIETHWEGTLRPSREIQIVLEPR